MAFAHNALSDDSFPNELFAACALGVGHGEDTILSRRVASRGTLLFVPTALFDHPNSDSPKAYATDPFRMGFGFAWSRRLINDNYIWPRKVPLVARAQLFQSYLGYMVAAAVKSLMSGRVGNVKYALGYAFGAARGCIGAPGARVAGCPQDWRAAAMDCLSSGVHTIEPVPGADNRLLARVG